MNNIFTVNMLKTFEECPKKYEFIYIKNMNLPENYKNTESGNNIHNLINFYLKQQPVQKQENLLNTAEKELWKNFLNLNLSNCVKSEYSFFFKAEGIWLNGRIDALFEYNSGYMIADWKTGNFRHNEKEQFQTYFYLYSLYNILKSKKKINSYSDLCMKYFILRNGTEILVNLDDKLYNQIDEKLKIILGKIKKAMFLVNTNEHCKCCPFEKFCHQ